MFVTVSQACLEHKSVGIMWTTVGRDRGGRHQRGRGRDGPGDASATRLSTSGAELPTPKLSAPVADTRKSNQVSCRCASIAGVDIQLEGVGECSRTTGAGSDR